ncbi:hypothetical protein BASA81_000141 [Batrachochytrium salamandrivorans]|nr:hypothetical protein BASA81_000141 [Batrachochytrium salamandrivorans]
MSKASQAMDAWEKVIDEATGDIYWWNSKTNKSTWTDPTILKQPPPPPPPHSSQHHRKSSVTSDGEGNSRTSQMVGMVKSGSMKFKTLMQAKEPDRPAPPPTTQIASPSSLPPQAKRKNSLHQAVAVVKNAMNLTQQSQPDPNSIDGHLAMQAKERGVEVGEVIKNAVISGPSNVKQEMQVVFDAKTLRYTGIPDGWADEAHKQYGVPLATCPRETVEGYPDRIPSVLVMLKKRFQQLGGPSTDGVFRLAPDGQDVADAKFLINTGDALKSVDTTKDPHVVANLIKQFYRELKPAKILNCLSKDRVVTISALADLSMVGKEIMGLPEPNRSCFLWLLDLLAEVAALADSNRMTPTNLAIVLSPNLYDAGPMDPFEELVLSQKVAALTSNCLKWRISTSGKV